MEAICEYLKILLLQKVKMDECSLTIIEGIYRSYGNAAAISLLLGIVQLEGQVRAVVTSSPIGSV